MARDMGAKSGDGCLPEAGQGNAARPVFRLSATAAGRFVSMSHGSSVGRTRHNGMKQLRLAVVTIFNAYPGR
jgi:hypothetical protein